MRIHSTTPIYQSLIRSGLAKSTASTFGQQVDIAARSRIATSCATDQCEFCAHSPKPVPVNGMELSAYCRLMDSYEWWKGQQPPLELPDSKGLTEENITYLRERYSGSLSWEERVDALETMKEMGIITKEQSEEAMGNRIITIQLVRQPDGSLKPEHEPEDIVDETTFAHDWNIAFKKRPFAQFTSIENILSWVNKIQA